MRKTIYFLCLTVSCILFINCSKDTDDLTKEIVGEYLGVYSSNSGGDVTDFEVVVTKINDSRILIAPKAGDDFDSWETNIERFNSSSITSTIGQTDPSAIFTIGDPVGISFQRASEGDVYLGEMK